MLLTHLVFRQESQQLQKRFKVPTWRRQIFVHPSCASSSCSLSLRTLPSLSLSSAPPAYIGVISCRTSKKAAMPQNPGAQIPSLPDINSVSKILNLRRHRAEFCFKEDSRSLGTMQCTYRSSYVRQNTPPNGRRCQRAVPPCFWLPYSQPLRGSLTSRTPPPESWSPLAQSQQSRACCLLASAYPAQPVAVSVCLPLLSCEESSLECNVDDF